jgi:hypothetical protein
VSGKPGARQARSCRWCGASLAGPRSAWGRRSSAALCDDCLIAGDGPKPAAPDDQRRWRKGKAITVRQSA